MLGGKGSIPAAFPSARPSGPERRPHAGGETFDTDNRSEACMDVAWWAWAALSGGVLFVLWLDLFLFHREDRTVGLKEAGLWTVVWLALALVFGGVLWAWLGPDEATRYLVGYVVERSLSIDNIFVLVVLFAYFAVPPTARHRALIWGVVGALALRVVFILLGAVALEQVAWTAYVLGAFL